LMFRVNGPSRTCVIDEFLRYRLVYTTRRYLVYHLIEEVGRETVALVKTARSSGRTWKQRSPLKRKPFRGVDQDVPRLRLLP